MKDFLIASNTSQADASSITHIRQFVNFANNLVSWRTLYNTDDVVWHLSGDVLSEFNSLVNSRGIMLPAFEKPCAILVPRKCDLVNRGRYFRRNHFILSSLLAIGGGGIEQFKRSLAVRRVGGSTQDKINYVAQYNNENYELEYSFKVSLDSICLITFGVKPGSQVIASPRACIENYCVKTDSSCGLIHSLIGFGKKKDSMQIDQTLFLISYSNWVTSNAYSEKICPTFVWDSASRPKLANIRKKMPSYRMGHPASRMISFTSAHESYIALPIYMVVSKLLRIQFETNYSGICIGCKRMSSDWALMSKNFLGSKFIYVGDYSKYDQSVPINLLRRAFDVIFNMFEKQSDKWTARYILNYKLWLETNIFKRYQHVDRQIFVRLESGVPSGSIWTSIINSIINTIIIEESLKQLKCRKYKYFVYGDDHIIIVYDNMQGGEFKRTYEAFVKEKFNMKLDPANSYISSPGEYYVTYRRPVYNPTADLAAGTHNLEPVRYETSDAPFTEYDHTVGTTHRWNYIFSRRVKFLQFYWLKTGQCVRPWPETLSRLVNTETHVRSFFDNEVLCVSHLIDNYGNAHVRNWMYHLLYDSWHMKAISGASSFLSEQANLYKYPDIFAQYTKNERLYSNEVGSRGWYRKRDGHFDLLNEPCMSKFNNWWWSIIEKVEYIIEHLPQEQLFKKNDIIVALGDRARNRSINSDTKIDIERESECMFDDKQNITALYILLLFYMSSKSMSTEELMTVVRHKYDTRRTYTYNVICAARKLVPGLTNYKIRSVEELTLSCELILAELITRGQFSGEWNISSDNVDCS